MGIKVADLTDADRQALSDSLHDMGVVPTKLQGTGSPAHLASISANLNDLRQILSVMQSNHSRLFDLIGVKTKRTTDGGGV